MDKLGPLAHTAHDCGLILNAVAGRPVGGQGAGFPPDEMTSDRPFAYPPTAAQTPAPPFRLAVLPGAADGAQPAVKANYEASLEVLKTLGTVEEVELPNRPYSVAAVTLINAEGAAAYGDFVAEGLSWDLTAPEDRFGGYAGRMIPAVDYINALRLRAKFARELDEAFAPYDAVVTPARATVAPPLEAPFREYAPGARAETLGGPANAAGLPGLCLPNGFDGDGLPTGLNLVGRAFGDARALAVGRAYQAATDWHEKSPAAWA